MRRKIGPLGRFVVAFFGGGLFLLVLPAAAGANVFETIGAGPRGSAMLAVTGLAEGAPATWYDPAGIVDANAAEVSLSFSYTQVNLTINGANTDEEEISGTMLGVAYPTDLAGLKVGIGVLFYLPIQRVSRLLALPLDQPQFLYYGDSNQRMMLMAAGAVRLTEWFSLGVGFQTLIDTFSEPDFTIVQDTNPENDDDPAEDAKEAQSFGYASVVENTVLAPLVGIRLGPFQGFGLGVTYRGEVEAKLGAPLNVSIEKIELVPGFPLPLAASRFMLPNQGELFFSPNQISGGLTYRSPEDIWKVDLDITWYQWSRFPPTFAKGLPTFIGGLGKIILPVPGFLPIKPPTVDTVVPSLGAEWLAFTGESVDLQLRGGYCYRPAMVEEDHYFTNFLDTTSHVIGAGFGVTIRDWSRFVPKPLSIDGYFQAHVLEERDIVKDRPADSRFGDLEIGGLLVGGGIQATVRF